MRKLILLFMTAVLLTGCVRYSGGEPVNKPEEEKSKEEVKKDEAPLTLKDQVAQIVTTEIGEKNNTKKERIAELNVEGNIVYLKLNASENFINDMTKKKMWKDSLDILEPISKIETVEGVIIHWMFPLVDQYGNSKDGNVMAFNVERETLDKINWDNFLTDDLPKVVSDYFEHQALSE